MNKDQGEGKGDSKEEDHDGTEQMHDSVTASYDRNGTEMKRLRC